MLGVPIKKPEEPLFSHDKKIFILNGSINKKRYITIGRWPVWSPDGEEIAYICGNNLCIIDSNGKDLREITHNEKKCFVLNPRWNGMRHIYFTHNCNNKEQEMTVDLKENRIRKVPKFDYLHTLEELESITIYPSPNGIYDLENLYYINKGLKTILINKISHKIEDIKPVMTYPAWSKDSKKIANYYASGTDEGSATNFIDKLIIYHIKNHKIVKVLKNLRGYEQYTLWCHGTTWSPDSKYIAYECAPYTGESTDHWIYIVNLRTGKTIKFIQGSDPDWY